MKHLFSRTWHKQNSGTQIEVCELYDSSFTITQKTVTEDGELKVQLIWMQKDSFKEVIGDIYEHLKSEQSNDKG